MSEESSVLDEDGVEVWWTWEAYYVPYPRLLDRLGFDGILDRIDEALSKEGGHPLSGWSDLLLKGEFQRVIVLSAAEPEDQGADAPQPRRFQDDVATLVSGLGLEGHIEVRRVVNASRATYLGGDED